VIEAVSVIDPSDDISSYQTAPLAKKKVISFREGQNIHLKEGKILLKFSVSLGAFTIACLSYTICSIVACTLHFRFLKFTGKK